MKNTLLILSLSIFTFSCNMSDYSEELPGNYTFVHDGKENNSIHGKHNIYSNVIEYAYNDEYITACQMPNRELYLSHFESLLSVNYSCYNDYMKDSTSEKFYKSRNEILADSTIYKIYKNRKVSFENTSEDKQKGNEIADSIIKNNPMHKKVLSLKKVYWIIEIKNDVLFGPLSESEYKLKRKELNLSDELKLS